MTEMITMALKLDGLTGEMPLVHYLDDDANMADYCGPCAEIAAKNSLHHGDVIQSCGADYESDGARTCETCGTLLAYVLTDYGLAQELEHFKGYRFRKPLNKFVAYEVARILFAAMDDNKAAVALGRRAMRAMS